MQLSKWQIAFLINWGVWILVYEFVALKKVRSITHGKEDIHKKYPAFRRTDAHLFTKRFWHWALCWTFPFKFVLVVLGMVGLSLCGIITMKIKPKDQKSGDLTGLIGWIIRNLGCLFSRIILFAIANVFWIRRHYPRVCYKKYLGPDWRNTDEKPCAAMVANHQAF